MTKYFVLSPCGTSLLTNAADEKERKLVGKYANCKNFDQIDTEDGKVLKNLIEKIKDKICRANDQDIARMSAELNAIIKLYENDFSHSEQHFHQLLCTDTWLGETTAKIVCDWLRSKKFIVDIKRQTDLQTAELTPFQLSLSDLVKWAEQTLPEYHSSGYKIIFNLTGGFKSVQGFLQTLGMFHADEIVYIFETGKELLRIPRIPVEMSLKDTVKENLAIIRKLSLGIKVEDTAGIPETLLMKIENDTTLSPWGELVWAQSKDMIYSEKIHPSPVSKIQFGPDFEHSMKRLEANRLILINKRIDQLSQYFESSGAKNPRSLDFKAIQSNSMLPSTHEIEAWADKDAKRIYGHYEKGIFILDRLGEHL